MLVKEHLVGDFGYLERSCEYLEGAVLFEVVLVGADFCEDDVFGAKVKAGGAKIESLEVAGKFGGDFAGAFGYGFEFTELVVVEKDEFVDLTKFSLAENYALCGECLHFSLLIGCDLGSRARRRLS